MMVALVALGFACVSIESLGIATVSFGLAGATLLFA
jgi:hypothetical protein